MATSLQHPGVICTVVFRGRSTCSADHGSCDKPFKINIFRQILPHGVYRRSTDHGHSCNILIGSWLVFYQKEPHCDASSLYQSSKDLHSSFRNVASPGNSSAQRDNPETLASLCNLQDFISFSYQYHVNPTFKKYVPKFNDKSTHCPSARQPAVATSTQQRLAKCLENASLGSAGCYDDDKLAPICSRHWYSFGLMPVDW